MGAHGRTSIFSSDFTENVKLRNVSQKLGNTLSSVGITPYMCLTSYHLGHVLDNLSIKLCYTYDCTCLVITSYYSEKFT